MSKKNEKWISLMKKATKNIRVKDQFRSTLLDNPQFFEPKIKNKVIFGQQRTSMCSHERVNERKTEPTQQITRSHGYTSYLSGD